MQLASWLITVTAPTFRLQADIVFEAASLTVGVSLFVVPLFLLVVCDGVVFGSWHEIVFFFEFVIGPVGWLVFDDSSSQVE